MTETKVAGAVPRFELVPWKEQGIVAGITGKGTSTQPFDLGLAGTATPVGTVMENWRQLLAAMPDFSSITLSRQVHGTEVRWQSGGVRGLVIQQGADGHGTDLPGSLLAVTVADCVPIYLADPIERLVVLLHAGWRGVASGILRAGVDMLTARGSSVENLLMHCGVGICGNCYEVGLEVLSACGVPQPATGKGQLDLRKVLTQQGREQGITHISSSPLCSAHDSDRFFSHRAGRGADGRMVAYLGILPG